MKMQMKRTLMKVGLIALGVGLVIFLLMKDKREKLTGGAKISQTDGGDYNITVPKETVDNLRERAMEKVSSMTQGQLGPGLVGAMTN